MILTKACPRCGGAIFKEDSYHGIDYRCLQCGGSLPKAQVKVVLAGVKKKKDIPKTNSPV